MPDRMSDRRDLPDQTPQAYRWPELRDLLREQGLSVADLSRLTGIRYGRLTRYLCGYALAPVPIIGLIADRLGVDLLDIFPERDLAQSFAADPRLHDRTRRMLRELETGSAS